MKRTIEGGISNSPITDSSAPLFSSNPNDDKVHEFGSRLQTLLYEAHEAGVVITVELEPLEPLAMRNYRMHGKVRGER